MSRKLLIAYFVYILNEIRILFYNLYSHKHPSKPLQIFDSGLFLFQLEILKH